MQRVEARAFLTACVSDAEKNFRITAKREEIKPKFHEEIYEHNQISSRNNHYNIVLWLRKLKSCICVADIFQARVCKEAWKGRTGSAPRVNLQPFVCRSSFPLCVKKTEATNHICIWRHHGPILYTNHFVAA